MLCQRPDLLCRHRSRRANHCHHLLGGRLQNGSIVTERNNFLSVHENKSTRRRRGSFCTHLSQSQFDGALDIHPRLVNGGWVLPLDHGHDIRSHDVGLELACARHFRPSRLGDVAEGEYVREGMVGVGDLKIWMNENTRRCFRNGGWG